MSKKQENSNIKIENEEIMKSENDNIVQSSDKQDEENNKIEESEDFSLENQKETEEKKIEEITAEVEGLRDEKLRLLAEMENLRKRSAKDKNDWIKYGSINLARDVLSPSDNLTRALEAIPPEEKRSESINNLIDGLKMVQKEFMMILEKHGEKKIKALNNKFDHNLHQAMLEVESDKHDAGTVVQEIQPGFTMHERLLRPSMVGVSKMTENKKKDKND